MIRFIHGADFHTGYRQYGLVERASDFMDGWHRFCNTAIETYCNFVVLPGDLFHLHTSDPLTLSGVVLGLKRLKNHGIPVYAIKGNHEISRIATEYDWMDFLHSQQYLELIDTFEGRNGVFSRCRIYGVPWSGFATDSQVAQVAPLMEPDTFNILMLHAGMEDVLSRNHPGTLSYEVLRQMVYKVSYVAMGHVHKPHDNGFIMNPGSPETCSIDEAKWPERGWFIVDVQDDLSFTYQRIPYHDRRAFIVAEKADFETLEWIAADGKGAVIHIRYGTDKDRETILKVCDPLYLRVEKEKPAKPDVPEQIGPALSQDEMELTLLRELTRLNAEKIIELKYETEGGIIYGKAKEIRDAAGSGPASNQNDPQGK